ncbi:MAG: hypothetical protein K0U66_03200 [Gammaproteobacteria bacterium]|nr:hypothetical protein [Gammaproteobacteria bacterium]
MPRHAESIIHQFICGFYKKKPAFVFLLVVLVLGVPTDSPKRKVAELTKDERIVLNKINKSNYLYTDACWTPVDKENFPPDTAIGFKTKNGTDIFFNKLAEDGTVIPWGKTLTDLITFADNLNLADGEYLYVSGGSEMNGHTQDSAHYYNKAIDFSIKSADHEKLYTGSGHIDNVLKALQGTGFTHIITYPGKHHHIQRTSHNIIGDRSKYLIPKE